MLTRSKIRYSILLCAVFVLSISSVSSKVFSSFASNSVHKGSAGVFAMLKERIQDNTVIKSLPVNHTVQTAGDEFIEDDDDSVDMKVSFVCDSFCTLPKTFINSSKLEVGFDLIKCNLYPKKYIALSILKI